MEALESVLRINMEDGYYSCCGSPLSNSLYRLDAFFRTNTIMLYINIPHLSHYFFRSVFQILTIKFAGGKLRFDRSIFHE